MGLYAVTMATPAVCGAGGRLDLMCTYVDAASLVHVNAPETACGPRAFPRQPVDKLPVGSGCQNKQKHGGGVGRLGPLLSTPPEKINPSRSDGLRWFVGLPEQEGGEQGNNPKSLE